MARPNRETQREEPYLVQKRTARIFTIRTGSWKQQCGFFTTPSILALDQQGGEH